MHSTVLVKGTEQDFILQVNPSVTNSILSLEPGESATDIVANNHSQYSTLGVHVDIMRPCGSVKTVAFVVGTESFKVHELQKDSVVSRVTATLFIPRPEIKNSRY